MSKENHSTPAAMPSVKCRFRGRVLEVIFGTRNPIRLEMPVGAPDPGAEYVVRMSNIPGGELHIQDPKLQTSLIELVQAAREAARGGRFCGDGWFFIEEPAIKLLNVHSLARRLRRQALYGVKFPRLTVIKAWTEGKGASAVPFVKVYRNVRRGVRTSAGAVLWNRAGFSPEFKKMVHEGVIIPAFIDTKGFPIKGQLMALLYKRYGLVPLGGSSGMKRVFLANLHGVGEQDRPARFLEVARVFASAFGTEEECFDNGGRLRVAKLFKTCLLTLRSGAQITSDRVLRLVAVEGAGEPVTTASGKTLTLNYEDGLLFRTRPGVLQRAALLSGLNASNVWQGTLLNPWGKGLVAEAISDVENDFITSLAAKAGHDPAVIDGYINMDQLFGNRARALKPGDVVEVKLNDFLVTNASADFRPDANVSTQLAQYMLDEHGKSVNTLLQEVICSPMVETLEGNTADSTSGQGRAQLYGFPSDYYAWGRTAYMYTVRGGIKSMLKGSVLRHGSGATLQLVCCRSEVFGSMVDQALAAQGWERPEKMADNRVYLVSRRTYESAGGDGEHPVLGGLFKNPVMALRNQIHAGWLVPFDGVQGPMAYCHADTDHRLTTSGDFDGDTVTFINARLLSGNLRGINQDPDMPVLADIRVPSEEVVSNDPMACVELATANLASGVGRAEAFMSTADDLYRGRAIVEVNGKLSRVHVPFDHKEAMVQASTAIQAEIDKRKKYVPVDTNLLINGRSLGDLTQGYPRSIRQMLKKARSLSRGHSLQSIKMAVQAIRRLHDVLPDGDMFKQVMSVFLANVPEYNDSAWILDGYHPARGGAGKVKARKKETLAALIMTATAEEELGLLADKVEWTDLTASVEKALKDPRFINALKVVDDGLAQAAEARAAARKRETELANSNGLTDEALAVIRADKQLADSVRGGWYIALANAVAVYGRESVADEAARWLVAGMKLSPAAWFRVAPSYIIEGLAKVYWALRNEGRIYQLR